MPVLAARRHSVKPPSGKQDKLQLGDTGDSRSCLNESCLQPSRGITFLQRPGASGTVGTQPWAPKIGGSAAHTSSGPSGPGQGRTGMEGHSLCRGAWLCCGSFGGHGGAREQDWGRWACPVPSHPALSPLGHGHGPLCQGGGNALLTGFSSREAAAGRRGGVRSWSSKASNPIQPHLPAGSWKGV